MTASIRLGSMGNGAQFFRRNCLNPWNKPQSTNTLLEPEVTKYFEPVTVPVAPRNVIFKFLFRCRSCTLRHSTTHHGHRLNLFKVLYPYCLSYRRKRIYRHICHIEVDVV